MKDFAFRSKPIVFQRTPSQRRSRHVPETVVSRPRDGRITTQRRSYHDPEAVASAPRFADRHRVYVVEMQFS